MANNSFIPLGRNLTKQRTFLWSAIALLLVYWIVRTWAITTFPPFIDEAVHIDNGRAVLSSGPFARIAEGRQFVIWLYILFGAQTAAPVWVARVATLLMTMVGFAALIGTGRLLTNGWGAIFAGLLLIFSPYHQFFERLALADPISASAVMVAVYFAARLSLRVDFRDAALCGIALFFACGAKVSALPYMMVPILAMLTLRRSQAGVRWAVEALVVGVGLSAVFFGIVIWRGYNPFYFLMQAGSTNASRFQVILTNVTGTVQMLINYFGILAAGLMIASLVIITLRRRLFLPLCLIIPLCVLWLSSRQDSRYYIAPMTLLVLSPGLALNVLSEVHSMWRVPMLAVVIIWGLVLWLPVAVPLVHDPANLPLPADDYNEYMASEGSGFGLDAVIASLDARHPARVIGILANCLSLRDLAPFPVECPRLNPTGEDKPTLENLLSSSRAAGVYAVLESIPYAPDSAPGTVVATIDTQRPRLTIYDLTP